MKQLERNELWETIATGKCPDCDHEGFEQGPRGGLSINIKCANPTCGAKFNITPVVQLAERI